MGQESLKIFDLDQVTVVFSGLNLNQGIGEGAKISFEKVKPSFTTKEGADGSIARSKTGSKLWKILVPVLQTSQVNAILSTILTVDENAPNGAGVGPFLMKDGGGVSLFIGAHCWIEGWAKQEIGAEAGNNEWTLICSDGNPYWGGN